jgi:O-antigen ligase
MAAARLFFNRFSVSGLAFFFCCLIIAGMLTTHFARSLSSIGTIGLLLTALFSLRNKSNRGDLKHFSWFVGFLLIFLLHLAGIFQPEMADPGGFRRDLTMKLPLLIFPVCFALLPVLPERKLNLLYYFFIVCVFAGSLYSTGYYLTHFDYVNELYKHSDIMETPTNHVRFSLMVAFAILVGYKLCRQGFYWRRTWEKVVLALITGWLFIFLHMLAVRSGLVAFYAVAGLGLAFDFFFRKQYKRTLVIGVGFIVALVAAFYTLPTFYNKFFLTLEDVKSTSEAKSAHDYSIAGRVYSYKVAMEVFKEHPVMGVGTGNLEAALEKKYASMFPEILNRGHILPHNQFIFILAVFGLIGLVIFMAGFYYPFLRFAGRFEPFFLFHYLIISFSFLFETTLETQVGLNYSLIFIMLPLWYFRSRQPASQTWKNGTFFA